YPLAAVTAALKLSSRELKELAEELSLPFTRCPQGHRFIATPGLHVKTAHYCPKCQRWFTDGMLRDEVNLEVARLQAQERPLPEMDDPKDPPV
ncbi:MAG: hypothetical protein QW587_07545, partial [Candidatus Bathyarchaeia archaeon]